MKLSDEQILGCKLEGKQRALETLWEHKHDWNCRYPGLSDSQKVTLDAEYEYLANDIQRATHDIEAIKKALGPSLHLYYDSEIEELWHGRGGSSATDGPHHSP